jgi:DNA polymerase
MESLLNNEVLEFLSLIKSIICFKLFLMKNKGFAFVIDVNKVLNSSFKNKNNNSFKLYNLYRNVKDCKRCNLFKSRKNVVFGVGNINSKIMFIGEAPGEHEDKTGFPFVGKSGVILNNMIRAMRYMPEDVYICNLIKCRPPGNRNPKLVEIKKCRIFVEQQLSIIKPIVVISLGAYASNFILNKNAKISQIRGKFFRYKKTYVMPTYHPSYLLRNPEQKKYSWNDLKKVISILK